MIRSDCGYLELRIGSMRSGKSSYVALKIAKLSDEGFKCLFVNHSLDERDNSMNINTDGSFSRHGKTSFKLSKDIQHVKVDALSSLDVSQYQVIGVDECQFFGEEMVSTIKKWVNDEHKIVFCSGLDGDIHKNIFGHLLKLIPEADCVTKQNADCLHCQQELQDKNLNHFYVLNLKAPFSALMSTSKPEKSDSGESSQIRIGGSDIYTSVCRYHHKLLMMEK
jgi:thymidine kinase